MQSSSKRPTTDTSVEHHSAHQPPRKRRAQYVWRACDACRRRKGRCDGRKPCAFCRSRSAECHYSVEGDPNADFGMPDERPPTTLNTQGGGQSNLGKDEPVSRIVQSLQAQLDSLMAHIQSHSEPKAELPGSLNESVNLDAMPASAFPSQNEDMNNSYANISVLEPNIATSTTGNVHKSLPRRYHGPTSPDYALNAAEIKLRQAQAPAGMLSPEDDNDPSFEDNQNGTDQNGTTHEAFGSSTQTVLANTRIRQCLAQLPRLLARNETIRLLGSYQNIIGNLHPVVDLERLAQEAEICYIQVPRRPSESMDIHEDVILILFLVLAIALAAESVSQSFVAKTLYQSVEPIIKTKLTSDVTSLDQVLIAVLSAIFHFFNDELRLGWRICGIAGRMAMELGLHRKDVYKQLKQDASSHTNISVLIWTIIVLDRGWSAAGGLPQNFQESDFDKGIELPDNLYLKSMISYTFMSPKFERPIYHVADGENYEADDVFEMLNFQIDQWQNRALTDENIFHPNPKHALGMKSIPDQTKPPSAVATLLYLRANAFRSIILRPFFLLRIPSHVSVKMIRPSMAVVSDTISVLALLDTTTDLYQKQHPFYQHLLNSSCALLLLVIAYFRVDRSRLLLIPSTDFAEPLPELVKKEVKNALALASAYSNYSTVSNRLSKRLRHLDEQLSRSEFFQPANLPASIQNQTKRAPATTVEKSNQTSNGIASNFYFDPSNVLQAQEALMGDDAFIGTWWNEIDMFIPHWSEPELPGQWM